MIMIKMMSVPIPDEDEDDRSDEYGCWFEVNNLRGYLGISNRCLKDKAKRLDSRIC